MSLNPKVSNGIKELEFNTTGPTMQFLLVLGLLLSGCKIAGYLPEVSWWWVTLPMWFTPAFILLFMAMVVGFYVFVVLSNTFDRLFR